MVIVILILALTRTIMALWGSKSRAGEQHAKVEEDQVLCCDKRGNSDSILSSEDFDLSKAYSLELPLDVSGISQSPFKLISDSFLFCCCSSCLCCR